MVPTSTLREAYIEQPSISPHLEGTKILYDYFLVTVRTSTLKKVAMGGLHFISQ